MQRFNAQALKAYLDACACEAMPLLLDVREPWEYDYCHMEGSELIPMGQLPAVTDELDPEREVVVICHHGVRSYQVACYLEHIGFSRVINLEGGIDAWAREIDPSIKRY